MAPFRVWMSKFSVFRTSIMDILSMPLFFRHLSLSLSLHSIRLSLFCFCFYFFHQEFARHFCNVNQDSGYFVNCMKINARKEKHVYKMAEASTGRPTGGMVFKHCLRSTTKSNVYIFLWINPYSVFEANFRFYISACPLFSRPFAFAVAIPIFHFLSSNLMVWCLLL